MHQVLIRGQKTSHDFQILKRQGASFKAKLHLPRGKYKVVLLYNITLSLYSSDIAVMISNALESLSLVM